MNRFFTDKQGNPLLLTGLQAHNSSTGTDMLDKAIHAVKLYGGNVLETPIYWYAIEPEKDHYDMSLIRETIDRTRKAGLYLILLWFGTSKNGHPNYVPEYIKLDPATYRPAINDSGSPLVALTPHCAATLERDALAFERVMAFLKEYDGETGTVIGVQVENEMGIGYTDRDYSTLANRDYEKPLPEELRDVELEDCGERDGSNTWVGQFGRHAHEAFNAWYHALYIGQIARRGRAQYDFPVLYTNVMIGETGYEEPGKCYNSGAAVGRVLDIWKKGAPALDLIAPDIYNPELSVYSRICSRYARPDNALFIPETSPTGEAFAMDLIRAAADYGAIGLCGFGAESALTNNGELSEDAYPVMVSMHTIQNLAPLLIRYRGTRTHPLLPAGRVRHKAVSQAPEVSCCRQLPARFFAAPRAGFPHQSARPGEREASQCPRSRHPDPDRRGRILPGRRRTGAGFHPSSRGWRPAPLRASFHARGRSAELPLR